MVACESALARGSITAVGSTTVVPETAAPLSSGGSSNYFAFPNYQASAVQGYLTGLASTYQGLFNPTGWAFPDVPAYGLNFMIAGGG
jgi:tripeptidyl-peptidase I